jgi:hypothetical protein
MKAFRELPIVWQYRKMAPWAASHRHNHGKTVARWSKSPRTPAPAMPAFLGESIAAELSVPALHEG